MDCAYASRCFPHARALRERRLRLQAVPAAARCPLLRAHVRAQVLDGEVDERLRVKGRRGSGSNGLPIHSSRFGGYAAGRGSRKGGATVTVVTAGHGCGGAEP